MEVTAPAAVLVVGFPLLMMLVMLLMNAVERRLTGSGRPALRLVPSGGEETTLGNEGMPAPTVAAAAIPNGPNRPNGPTRPVGPTADGAERPVAAGHRHTLHLMPVDLVTANLAPGDAARAFTHSAVRTVEAGALSRRAEAGYS
ncbi:MULTISPECIES: hypothetical protein [unclassified Pseudofrankia]|uniref:hypothetical protein n=1 Tax=unclassified Pseudofrankia TaxID=2994372 RepID=UPI0008D963B7|nr:MULTISPECIES: hypothetical protein [unclassified Pseudofrankia]MDT3446295.1 hypothetical protein [Pseudofrankia sp. BMG5.37]OHV74780.1 hypothetical protein BCD48_02865 [Pseudofrankia sp. BMG5.36]